MGQTAHSHGGGMDISDQKRTFSGFMAVTVWGSALIVMSVALLVVAFAMGAGWFAGLGVFAVLGVVLGMLLRMGAAWWATVIGLVILLAIGGGVGGLVSGLIG